MYFKHHLILLHYFNTLFFLLRYPDSHKTCEVTASLDNWSFQASGYAFVADPQRSRPISKAQGTTDSYVLSVIMATRKTARITYGHTVDSYTDCLLNFKALACSVAFTVLSSDGQMVHPIACHVSPEDAYHFPNGFQGQLSRCAFHFSLTWQLLKNTPDPFFAFIHT